MTTEDLHAYMEDLLHEKCDQKRFPQMCNKIKTEAGRTYIKKRIIHLVTKEGFKSISATLPHIENELTFTN